ncbi:hypothetical protein LQ51_12515 [Micromonospora sp. HK10]|nr:hypothetical protein LQ51_12515 [Micromonospora sp. HK10]
MIAIMVAVLILLCSGVISYNYRKYMLGADPGALAPVSVTSGAVRSHGADDLVGTSYRREVRLQPADGETTTSEGRETR